MSWKLVAPWLLNGSSLRLGGGGGGEEGAGLLLQLSTTALMISQLVLAHRVVK